MNPTETKPKRKLFLLAGEASGDLYGGQLAQALLTLDPDLEIRGWGGEAMEAAGVRISTHYKDLAFMGFWEVLKNLGTIRRNLNRCTAEILAFQPDAFVGIDFPGFNLRVAANMTKSGIFTHHYISPSIWAWNARRIHRIKRSVQRMHVAMPFELAAYESVGMDARFVGHPLISLLEAAPKEDLEIDSSLPILALLPGSRTQELKHLLPVMIKTAQSLPQFQAVIAGAPGQEPAAYAQAIEAGIPVVFNKTRTIMSCSSVGLITSGTATLEASLLGLPQIICYRTSSLTYRIAKLLAQVAWIGLPNIILGGLAIPERIQADCNANTLRQDVLSLHDGKDWTPTGQTQQSLAVKLKALLGSESAASNTAVSIMERL
jgi:lipid-A-disaccharide synthase